MFKKLLVASAILAMTSHVAMAGVPYVGASMGVVATTSGSGNFRGLPITVSGGYGSLINPNVYLGGEIFGVLTTVNFDNNAQPSLKTTYGYGISFIPGLMLSEHTMTYARLGVVRSRFTNYDKNVTGGQAGVGIQTSVTQNVDLRGEYDYTKYTNFSNVKSDGFNLGLVYKIE